MNNEEKSKLEAAYKKASSQALDDVQSGKISFHEWNRLQKQAVNEYYKNAQ
jgi:hypothetical protein